MKYFMKKLILKKSTEDKNHETLPIMQRVNNKTIAIGIRVLIAKNARKSSGESLQILHCHHTQSIHANEDSCHKRESV